MNRTPTDALVTALGFGALFFFAYFASTAIATPLPWYYPELHQWEVALKPHGLAMDFFGRIGLSLLCGVGGALAARVGLRVAPDAVRGRGLTLLLWWNVSLFVFTSGLYISILSARAPIATPLPEGYVAR